MTAIYRKSSGFTLAEVLVAIIVLAMVIVGLLTVFVQCSTLADLSGNTTLALSDARTKLEEIRNHNFITIVDDYAEGGTPGNVFGLPSFASGMGAGRVYINQITPDLLQVKVVACWQNRDGRIIGTDTNLNGVVDFGESHDGSGEIDSPVKLVTYITRR